MKVTDADRKAFAAKIQERSYLIQELFGQSLGDVISHMEKDGAVWPNGVIYQRDGMMSVDAYAGHAVVTVSVRVTLPGSDEAYDAILMSLRAQEEDSDGES